MKHILIGTTWEDKSIKEFKLIYTLSNKNRFLSIFMTSEADKRYILQEEHSYSKDKTTWGIK